ncbi:MAG: amino acid adenylation domain-containing protein, partial [Acidobacteriota bacterium]
MQRFPLSPQQRRMWSLARNEPQFRSEWVMALKGPFDKRALQEALQKIIARHEILRTTFHSQPGYRMPFQTPSAAICLDWSLVDLSRVAEGGRDALLDEICPPRGEPLFDHQHGPLLHLVLVRFSSTCHALAGTLSSMCADSTTLQNFFAEICRFYLSLQDGPAEEILQYTHFTEWQNALLEEEEAKEGTLYWSGHEGLSAAALKLPFEMSPPSGAAGPVQRLQRRLDRQLTARAGTLAARNNLSESLLYLACWECLLRRLTGRKEVVTGCISPGREHEMLQSGMGLYSKCLPVHCQFEEGQLFSQVLRNIETAWQEADEWRDYLAWDSLAKHKRAGFPFEFEWIGLPGPCSDSHRTASLLRQSSRTSRFHLKLTCFRESEQLLLGFEYDPLRFDGLAVQRMSGYLENIVRQIVTDLAARVDSLQLLSEGQLHQVMTECNDTTFHVAFRGLHQYIEQQASRVPDRKALVYGDVQLSYRELDWRAGLLALRLRKVDAGPGRLVGIYADRSLETVPALLGVLKCGAAYLPLNLRMPRQALSFVLADARPAVVLAGKEHLSQLPELQGELFVIEEAASQDRPLEAARFALPSPQPHDLAYVIFTSGSTGRHKGVEVGHGQIVNYLHGIVRRLQPPEGASFALVSTFAADLGNTSLFGSLCCGGCLHLFSEALASDADRLAVWLERSPVDYLKIVPSHLAALQSAFRPQRLLPRLGLILGGEACRREWAEQLLDQMQGGAVFNHYGPTEAAVGVMAARISRGGCGLHPQTLPLGAPLANSRVYLLDERLQPVPDWVPGQLYIGGEGVARGYLGRPRPTAGSFIPDPFSRQAGRRLYATGDLVRRLPGAGIEFVGRTDHQVKLRGYRIELGEIESALLRHASVREAVAMLREDTPGEKRLVAYLVAKKKAPLEPGQLRGFLQQAVAEQMIPSVFVRLDDLPLTPNGKVDRQALPPPASGQERKRPPVAPRTPQEAQLAEIWKELLRLGQVGVEDNFFELGGDSILSIQVMARANQAGLKLSARDAFRYQTIAELAAAAGLSQPQQAEQGPVEGDLPLTPIQQRFFELDPADPRHWNQSVLMRAPAGLEPRLIEAALQILVRQHDALRLRFLRQEEGWRQFNAPQETAALLVHIDLSRLRDASGSVERAAGQVQASLSIDSGPLLRAAWMERGSGKSGRLLVVIHHLAVDGVSWRILLEDFQTAYDQLSRAEPVRLPAKTGSFKQWAVKLERFAQTGALDQEADYWQDAARRLAPRLPVDYQGGQNREGSARVVSAGMTRQETRELLQEVPRAYRTRINDVLMTALVRTLAPWCHSESVLVDLEGHGRQSLFEELDHSRTVGWFTCVYPVLLQTGKGQTEAEALKSVKEQLRRVPGGGIGYGLLRYLNEDSEAGRAIRDLPGAQLSFNYLGQLDQAAPASTFLRAAPEPRGFGHSPRAARRYLLNVIASVSGGRLQVSWVYGREVHLARTIEQLAQSFTAVLRSLIAHCLKPESRGWTPSDFPLAPVDQALLDNLAKGGLAVEDIYALTPIQQGLLFHSLYSPQSDFYVRQLVCRLEGPLHLDAWRRAWEMALQRHSVLRTFFLWEDVKEPLQVVLEGASLNWQEADWRQEPFPEQQKRLEEWIQTDRRRGFSPSEAPLMRHSLIRLSDSSCQFIWSYHHLLLDGWSLALLFRELVTIYRSLASGAKPQLEAAHSFRDYLDWLQQQDMFQAETFWRHALQGIPPHSFSDSGRTFADREPTSRREVLAAQFQPHSAEQLQQLARRQRLTLNTLLQGAWALLLSRFSGRRRVVFGAILSGRPAELPGVESMVGPFINTLPIPVRLSGNDELAPWLQALQNQAAEIRRFEFSPLFQVQNWSEAGSGQALFESILVFENYPVEVGRSGGGSGADDGLSVRDVRSLGGTHYPLALVASPQLSFRFLFDPGYLDRSTVSRMARHLCALLQGLLTEPWKKLEDLPFLTASERHQLLVEWNATSCEYPRQQTISSLLQEQAEIRPDAVALQDDTLQLSYAELERRVAWTARCLRDLGVGPDTLVGFCLPRSVEMVAALAGILRAGGAYLPLDSDYPLERLAFMIKDSGAPLVLSHSSLSHRLPSTVWALELDRDWSFEQILKPAPCPAGPDNLAYTVYTSGSTGQPKGVAVTHRAVLRLVSGVRYAALGPQEVFLLLAPLSFDASTFELWGSLLRGARLVISATHRPSLEQLARLLRGQGITILWLTAPLFHLMADLEADSLSRLGQLLAGGDVLSASHVRRALAAGLPRLINGYGPTEGTTFSCCQPLSRSEEVSETVPIGTPIANTTAYVLDGELHPAPLEVGGELFIGGEGLARGYLNRPGLTAERFVPHPFGDGERLYRSGDQVRWRREGRLDFLGRLDQQVKLR